MRIKYICIIIPHHSEMQAQFYVVCPTCVSCFGKAQNPGCKQDVCRCGKGPLKDLSRCYEYKRQAESSITWGSDFMKPFLTNGCCVSTIEPMQAGAIFRPTGTNVRWPDVLFYPDMSSFRDLKNASGRDSKIVRDFASSDICVCLGLSQTSYYVLTSFGKGISLTFHLLARALTVERTVIGWPPSQCCNYPPNTIILSLWYDMPFPIWQHWAPCRLQ